MKQLFIAKNGTVKYGASKLSATLNTALTPDTLAIGAIGVYGLLPTGYTVLLTATATGTGLMPVATFTGGALTGAGTTPNIAVTVTAASGINRFFIAVGTNTGCFITDECSYKDVVQVATTEYSAPVKQVVTITPTMPSSLTTRDEYTISVVKRNTPDNVTSTYTVQGSFASATLVNDALRTKINADNKFVATGTATLIMTAANYGDVWEVAISGTSLLVADRVYTTAMAPGIGYGPSVLKEERKLASYRGFYNQADYSYLGQKSPVFYADTTASYDMYFIHFKVSIADKTLFVNNDKEDRYLEVAFVDGANNAAGENQADFDTIIRAMFSASFNMIPVTGNVNTAA